MTSRATGQQVKGSFDQWQTTFLVPVPGVHRRKQALPAGPASVLLHIDNKSRSYNTMKEWTEWRGLRRGPVRRLRTDRLAGEK
jgi:hypothetical protein